MKYLNTLAVALVLVLSPPVSAQHAEQVSSEPMVSTTDLSVLQYRPENLDAEALYLSLKYTIGRELFIEERGGRTSKSIQNLRTLGDMVIIYDTAEYGQRILAMCEKLDRAAVPTERVDAVSTVSYHPRYIGLASVEDLLRPLFSANSSTSFVMESGMVVLRAPQARLDDMLALLEKADRPQRQVLVTCYLLAGGVGLDSAGVPAELAQHLGKLVPDFGFRRIGFAMLQSSVAPSGLVRLKFDGPQRTGYTFTFFPTAFDRETNSMTVERCSLEWSGGEESTVIFSTSTVLRGGEYTVLGASGADPVFLAVRISPVES